MRIDADATSGTVLNVLLNAGLPFYDLPHPNSSGRVNI